MSLLAELIALTEQPYDNYNVILPEIKRRLATCERVQTFERVLGEEIILTTVRRAYRTAIRVALGEEALGREFRPHKKYW